MCCATYTCGGPSLAPECVCDNGVADCSGGLDFPCRSCNPGYSVSGCQTPSFSYSGAAFAGRLGGVGGGLGTPMVCTGNEVIIGLGLKWTSCGSASKTRTVCGSVSVNPDGSVSTAKTGVKESGGTEQGCWAGGSWTEQDCPAGYIVVGMRGKNAGSTLFSSAKLICGKLGASGGLTGEKIELSLGGTGGAPDTTVNCPPGKVAKSFSTRSGWGQDALDLECATLVEVCTGSGLECDANLAVLTAALNAEVEARPGPARRRDPPRPTSQLALDAEVAAVEDSQLENSSLAPSVKVAAEATTTESSTAVYAAAAVPVVAIALVAAVVVRSRARKEYLSVSSVEI